MANAFDQFDQQPNPFDQFDSASVQQPKGPASVPMSAAAGRKLPPMWDVEVDLGDGTKQPVRGVYDADAKAYLVPGAGGKGAYKIMKQPDGSLGLEKYAGPSALGSDMENFNAGAGKAVTDMKTGGKQVLSLAGNTVGLVSDEYLDQTMQEARDKIAADRELMSTKAGLAGNIAGNIATTVAGGMALKGAGAAVGRVGQGLAETQLAPKAGQALLSAGRAAEATGKAIVAPQGYKQAVLTGAAMGAAHPFQNVADLAINTGLGGLFGAGGQAVADGVGAAAQAVKALLPAKPSETQFLAAVAEHARQQGIDWTKLPDARKQQYADVVKAALAKPEAAGAKEVADRIARAESHGVPITQAQATKDVAAQLEQNRALPYSTDLQVLRDQQRAALNSKIDELVAGTKAPSGGDIAKAGESQKEGMRAFLGTTKQAVKEAYNKAEAEAGDRLLDPMPLINLMMKNKAMKGQPAILERLNDIGAFARDEAGKTIIRPVRAKDLYEVRKQASALLKSSDTAHVGGEAKTAIDHIYDSADIPQYTEAAALRRAQSKQFNERAIPSKLTGKKGQEDLIGDDKLMQWIIGRDTKDIGRYKQALVSGNEALLKPVYKADKDARKLGIQSARDLKAGFMRFIQNQATVKDEISGAQTISPEALVTAYKRMGGGNMQIADEKAAAILGPKLAARLKSLVQTAEDVSTPSAAQAKGSARFNEAITRGIGTLVEMMIPKVGGMVRTGAGELAAKSAGRQMARPASMASGAGRASRAPSAALALPVLEDR